MDEIKISEPLFTADNPVSNTEFATSMMFPDTCGAGVGVVKCNVAAFNERGRGRESDSVPLVVSCPTGGWSSSY